MKTVYINSWFSADVTSLCKLGFRHVGAHARCEIVCKSMPFLRAHVQSLQIIHLLMDISQESDPKSQDKIPVLSSYGKNLESHVRERYLKKISVVGVDPAAIPSEQFSSECLPPIEVSDLLSYLVLETSYYTNKQFKAFKSLEAYNQMVSGFVASVQGKERTAPLFLRIA